MPINEDVGAVFLSFLADQLSAMNCLMGGIHLANSSKLLLPIIHVLYMMIASPSRIISPLGVGEMSQSRYMSCVYSGCSLMWRAFYSRTSSYRVSVLALLPPVRYTKFLSGRRSICSFLSCYVHDERTAHNACPSCDPHMARV